MKRMRNVYAAYHWMLTEHPTTPHGLVFVLRAHRTPPAELPSAFRRWIHG